VATAPSIAYVIGVHNEEDALGDTTSRVVDRLRSMPGSEVILVENGSTDSSPTLVHELAQKFSDDHVSVRAEVSPKGLGNALRRGMQVATADRMILTAADLPFGFSDLDAALALDEMPDVVVGSKTHPQSKVETSKLRDVMSFGFRTLRRAMFGLDIGDTQGSVNIERELARRILPRLRSEGYFISTEVVVVANHVGASVAEVPVDYSNPRPDSKVRPVSDSAEVLKSMWQLRAALRRDDAAQKSR
jgi:glycosyltransferase involved in cell wall biosynthesis